MIETQLKCPSSIHGKVLVLQQQEVNYWENGLAQFTKQIKKNNLSIGKALNQFFKDKTAKS